MLYNETVYMYYASMPERKCECRSVIIGVKVHRCIVADTENDPLRFQGKLTVSEAAAVHMLLIRVAGKFMVC